MTGFCLCAGMGEELYLDQLDKASVGNLFISSKSGTVFLVSWCEMKISSNSVARFMKESNILGSK